MAAATDALRTEPSWALALVYLTLARTPGLGPKRYAALLQRFGTASEVLLQGRSGGWRALGTGYAGLAEGIDGEAAERELASGLRRGWRLCVPGAPGYPAHWQDEGAWPFAFWVRGRWPEAIWRDGPATVALVGPRRASAMACTFAHEVAARAAWAGAWVVSGLAFGVDAAAHLGALKAQRAGAAAGTVAVLAGGVDRPSPTAHLPLAEELLEAGGALWSAAPLGAAPQAGAFPARNRWIAGLAAAVAVVEAGPRSGALHTAQAAAELGRELLVAPARPWDAHAAGALGLLRDGAAPLIEADDLWRALPAGRLAHAAQAVDRGGPSAPAALAGPMAAGPTTAEALAAASGRPFHDLLALLEEGVVLGWARRLGGGFYALVEGAGVAALRVKEP